MLRFTDYGQEGIYICTGSQALYLLLAGKRIGSDTLTAPCKVEEDTCALQFLFSSSAKGDDIYEPGGTPSIRFSQKSVWFLHSCEKLSCLLLCCCSEALYQRQQTSPSSQFYTGELKPALITVHSCGTVVDFTHDWTFTSRRWCKSPRSKAPWRKIQCVPPGKFLLCDLTPTDRASVRGSAFTHGRAPEVWDKQKGILLQVELGPV